MTEKQIQLVENSWDYILSNISNVGEIFYDRLLSENPELKPLFNADVKSQAQKLVSMLTYVVIKLRELDTIIEQIEQLGNRHKEYGAKEEHYSVVGETLLWTLSNGLGSNWNSELADAWGTAFNILTTEMIRIAKEDSKFLI